MSLGARNGQQFCCYVIRTLAKTGCGFLSNKYIYNVRVKIVIETKAYQNNTVEFCIPQ